MALRIISPTNSFIQFGGNNTATSCNFRDISLCLPVYEEEDVYFQFVVQADTIEEADGLCDLTNSLVDVGIAPDCVSAFSKVFTQKPDRYRLSDFQVLYNWSHGLPAFDSVVGIGDCFIIKVDVDGQVGCSNCLQRIGSDCHTSVIEYGNDENAFGFFYCASGAISESGETTDCDPMFITFTDEATKTIPYTASMIDKYGNVPTIKVWIYDMSGELVNMSVRQAFDGYPATEIRLDFGGPATGVIKIS